MKFKSIEPSQKVKGQSKFEDNPIPQAPKLRFKELPKLRPGKLILKPHKFAKSKIGM